MEGVGGPGVSVAYPQNSQVSYVFLVNGAREGPNSMLSSSFSRGREDGLGLGQSGFWGGVAGSPPGREMMVEQPMLPETSWTVTGVLYKVRLYHGVGFEDGFVASLIGAIGGRGGGLGLGEGRHWAGVAGAPHSGAMVVAQPVSPETSSRVIGTIHRVRVGMVVGGEGTVLLSSEAPTAFIYENG
ncbi:unnamed protein product [Laminaria digitata]